MSDGNPGNAGGPPATPAASPGSVGVPPALSQAKELIRCLADRESLLLLSPPSVGNSAAVNQAACEAGLEVRSLLSTQIALEDVSGMPKLIGDRAVLCPT